MSVFTSSVTKHLLTGSCNVTSTIEELPEASEKEKLLRIIKAESEAELRALVSVIDSRFHAGLGYVVTQNNKTKFVNEYLRYFVVHHTAVCLEQVGKGLRFANFLPSTEISTKCFRACLQFNSRPKLRASDLVTLFDVEYSPHGSRRRELEEDIIMALRDVWKKMEARCVKGHVDGNSVVVTLNDFLALVTSSDFPPVIGFSPYPRIEFDYDLPANPNIRKKIHANTSTNRLNMPVYDALSTSETLEQEIVFCIFNAPDFGQI